MRKAFLVPTALAVCVVSVIVLVAANPLRRSEESIAAWLQAQTPLGSSRESVVAYAKEHGWIKPTFRRSDGMTSDGTIEGELGEYRSPFVTSVTAFWEFDSESRLARIRVWKTTDAL